MTTTAHRSGQVTSLLWFSWRQSSTQYSSMCQSRHTGKSQVDTASSALFFASR